MTTAVLGMYPFPHVRGHLDRLWQALVGRVADLPPRLDHERPVVESWHDAGLVVGQACGWPLVTELAEKVVVLGVVAPMVPFAADGRYRSVLVAGSPRSVSEWAARDDLTVAVNGLDSLSGWVSLCAMLGGRPSTPLVTGGHLASMRAVADRRADLASIDALTFEYAVEASPRLGALLHVIGHGPVVPALPLISARSLAPRRDELRAAFAATLADPRLASTRAALHLGSFVPLDLADYLPLTALDPAGLPLLGRRPSTH